jgi:hypothetical protein
MKYYYFKVDISSPPEYESTIREILDQEKRKADTQIQYEIHEAFQPEIFTQTLIITAASLEILLALYKIYKEKKEKVKVVVTIDGKDFDFHTYNVDEVKLHIGEPSFMRYIVKLPLPKWNEEDIIRSARTLSSRPIFYKGKQKPEGNEVIFSNYNQETQTIDSEIQIKDAEINDCARG